MNVRGGLEPVEVGPVELLHAHLDGSRDKTGAHGKHRGLRQVDGQRVSRSMAY